MLYLASTSPRRRQLMADAGFEFRVVTPGIEASRRGAPAALAGQRARSKADGADVSGPPGWVIGADTVVECAGQELGKPRDRDDARRMLEQLSGREHCVHTALCLVAHPARSRIEECVSATVRCSALLPDQLEAFLATGAWRGKAGGYGIQDDVCAFMELVAGDRDTVVGLPVATLRAMLERAEEGSG